jgi:outer membrane protein assembly factor BamA
VDKRTIGLNEQQLARLQSGGIQQRLFNLELLFPLAGDNIRGVVFYDAGQVNAEPIQYSLLNEHEPTFFELRQSYGFGIRMITPMGVFRFEYGVKLNPRRRESPDKFDFTISTLF